MSTEPVPFNLPTGTPTSATRHESKTGGSKDLKIQRYDQIPTGPLAELAARYGIGSLKYAQKNGLDNWRNGYPWSWSYRAMVGHANDFWDGETYDPNTYLGTDDESAVDADGNPRPGTHHLAAVAWHALAMIEWLETHPEHDDRPSTVVRRNEAGLSGTEEAPERIDEIRAAARQEPPCHDGDPCTSFAACSLECEQRYAEPIEFRQVSALRGEDIKLQPLWTGWSAHPPHLAVTDADVAVGEPVLGVSGPLDPAAHSILTGQQDPMLAKVNDLVADAFDAATWWDAGVKVGDQPTPDDFQDVGRVVSWDTTGVGDVTRRVYVPNASLEDLGEGKFRVTARPVVYETPQLELDDRVTFVDTTVLAFGSEQEGSVVAIRRDGCAVRYDVKLDNSGFVVMSLKPSQLVKQ